MHEKLERPEMLLGSTYKIKTPLTEHALYVTINDIVLNQGTPHEKRRPFEIFINSKNMDHFQWIVALTRIISAVFRKGGDVTFLVEELRPVFDPRGGYFKKGGNTCRRLVAELGDVIEKPPADDRPASQADELDEHQQQVPRREARASTRARRSRQDAVRQDRRLPGRRAAVRQVLHQGGGQDGWLHDLSQLRRLEVRMIKELS